jgi:hypothetical protein
MAFLRNRSVINHAPWTMAGQIMVENHFGPDCSYRGSPNVVLSRDEINGELPTTATRVDDFPENWVDLRWTQTDEGREYEGRVGYFLVYSTDRDLNGRPCPTDRMVAPDKMKVRFPPFGDPYVTAWPVHEGPQLRTCDGQIGVSSLTQAPPDVTAQER